MEGQSPKIDKLISAVIAVMKEAGIQGMPKNSKVGTYGNEYDATADKDVKLLSNALMAKHGLAILPIEIDPIVDIYRWEEKSEYNNKVTVKNKQSVFTQVKTKYLLAHESGQSLVVAGYGHGSDSQDKSAGKSTTYALKNLLLYSYLVPTGIDDTDTQHSEEMDVPRVKAKPTVTMPQKPEATTKEPIELAGVIYKWYDTYYNGEHIIGWYPPKGSQGFPSYKTDEEINLALAALADVE